MSRLNGFGTRIEPIDGLMDDMDFGGDLIMKYEDITGKIIGCAMKVHSFFGNGFQEVIYQRALALEFREIGLDYVREQEIPIYYKEYTNPIGFRRADFIVEGKVLVELKATTELNDIHYNQILNYLTAYRLEIGLLINFGENSLHFKRFINSKFAEKQGTERGLNGFRD